MNEHTRMLMAPESVYEQIQGVLRFYMPEVIYNHFRHDLARMDYVALEMFKKNDVNGYRPAVIRKALKILSETAQIPFNEAPWGNEELGL